MLKRPALKHLTHAALLGGLIAGAAAGPASADSIAFIEGGNVWLASGDGTRTARVTTTGGYASVSQDDAGQMVAVHGNRIAHLARDGRVLADILTPVSNPSGTQTFIGPFDAQISPNGRSVSYTYYWQYIGQDPYCNPSTGCYTKRLYQGTAYTDPDHFTEWDAPGYRRQSGWIHASWIDDATQLLSDPSMKPNEDLVLNSPGLSKDEGFQRWAEHAAAKQLEDGEMTRDRSKMAFITGDKNDHVWFYNVRTGYYPQYPSTCTTYELGNPAGGRFHDLSWSPDGSHLAYADGDGISTIAIPAFGDTPGDCGTPTEDSKLFAPGATSPDWGPADVPARTGGGAPTPTPTPGGGNSTPGPSPKPSPTSPTATTPHAGTNPTPTPRSGTAPAAVRVSAAADSLRKVLRSGLRVRLNGAAPGRVAVVARAGQTVIARGSVTVGGDGSGSATLQLSAAGRKRLAGRRSATVQLTAGQASTTTTLRR